MSERPTASERLTSFYGNHYRGVGRAAVGSQIVACAVGVYIGIKGEPFGFALATTTGYTAYNMVQGYSEEMRRMSSASVPSRDPTVS